LGAGRSAQQDALRDRAAEPSVLLRVAEEVDDLDELLLRLVDAGDVLEGGALGGGVVALGPAAAEAAEAARSPSARGATREPDEEADEEQGRAEAEDDRLPQRRALVERLGVHRHVLLDHQLEEAVVAE
jgi:hypothetical protein